MKAERHLRAYKEKDGPFDIQILDEVNRFGLKGMRITRAEIRSDEAAFHHGMRVVEYETKRVKTITAAEFLDVYVPETLRMIPDMENAFGRVDNVENIAIMMLQSMIMSFEQIDGKPFPNQVAAEHVVMRLRQLYEKKGLVPPV